MPGYDIPLQDGVVLIDRLKCHHCQLVMKDPVQTKETGLIFCRECFDEALKLALMCMYYAKQKHPGCKKSAGPIRSVVIVDQNV